MGATRRRGREGGRFFGLRRLDRYRAGGTIQSVTRRFIVAAALLLPIGIGGWLLASPQRASDVPAVLSAIGSGEETWAREDLYRSGLNQSRLQPVFRPQTAAVEHTNQNRIRVIVLGDSYTYPTGLVDLSAHWPTLLEERLNAETAPGSFEVVSVAASGASTYTLARWADDIQNYSPSASGANKSVIDERFAEKFDVLLVGAVSNDRFPGGYDPEIPEFLRGAAAKIGYEDSSKFRYVESGAMKYLYFGEEDPNNDLYPYALEHLRSSFKDSKAFWIPLTYLETERGIQLRDKDLYESSGFISMQTENVEDLLASYSIEELMVTGVDPHPGTALLRAYAEDAAASILDNIEPERLELAKNTAGRAKRDAVSFYAPASGSLTVKSEDGSRGKIVYTHSGSIEPCTVFSHNNATTACVGEKMIFKLPKQRNTAGGGFVEAAAQYAPCVSLGRPHAVLTLAYPIADISASLKSSAGNAPIDVYAISYDDEGFEVITGLVSLAPGGSKDLDIPMGTKALALAPRSEQTCGGQSEPIALSGFTVELDLEF